MLQRMKIKISRLDLSQSQKLLAGFVNSALARPSKTNGTAGVSRCLRLSPFITNRFYKNRIK
jgi:hypothetical protein